MRRILTVVLAIALVLALAACATTPTTTATSATTKATTKATTQATTQATTATTATTAVQGLTRTPAYEGARPTLKVTWNAAWFSEKAAYWPIQILTDCSEYMNIDLQFYCWESGDQMALDIASGDLTDIIEIPGTYIPQLLDAKMMVAMDDYLNYAPLLKSVSSLREAVMRKEYSNGDGKWYFWTPNVGLDVPIYDWWIRGGYKVRWDVYTELGYPAIKNDDDFIAYLKAAVAAHPKTKDGLQTYGYGLWVDEGLYPFWVSGGIYGYVNYGGNMFYDTDGTGIINAWTDEQGPIWRWINFCYKLNQEKLFDLDSFTMTSNDVDVKVNNGQYMTAFNTANLYELERAKDANTLIGYMDVPAEGTAVWGNMVNKVGPGFFYGITTNCKNIQAAMMFFNFMNAEDGNRLMMTGKQGVMWDYDASGKPVILQSAIERKAELTGDANSKEFYTFWNCVSGISNSQPLSDGGLGNLWGSPTMRALALNPMEAAYCQHYGISYPNEKFVKLVEEGKCWDASKIYYDAGPMVGTIPDEITMIETNIRKILVRKVPDLILAKDQATYDAIKAQVLADIKAADSQKAEDWWNAAYQKAVEFIKANA
jgi:putative aldouronate transport system substrate-binding protein